jgi:signal transduction histidine kinase
MSTEAVRVTSATDPSGATQLRARLGLLVALACVAVAGAALVVSAGAGLSAGALIAAALVTAWAAAAAVVGVRRPNDRLGPLGLWVAVLGAIGLLADTLARSSSAGDLAFLVGRLAVGLLPGVLLHLLLALPEGRAGSTGRRAVVAAGYLVSVGVGLALFDDRPSLPWWTFAAAVLGALAFGVPPSHARYRQAKSDDRRRLQWLGWSAAVGAEAALVVFALSVFVGWPGHLGEILAGLTLLLPLGLAAGASRRLVGHIDRVLAATVSFAGLTVLVVGLYLLVVIGLGHRPRDGERGVLLLSMAAAALAAMIHQPARDRLGALANRLVYGERRPPEDVLRQFGTRLTRTMPLDELLLQLAESLRKMMTLASAEVWTGADGRLEQTVTVPHRRTTSTLSLDAKDAAVVARAGVTGGTWLDVWLPDLAAGRDSTLLRVAPIAHAGELLGLLVCERYADSPPSTEDHDDILAQLARQVGLALHNVQLDTALQASLHQLRRKAEELQQSRARIVAAGDSGRRRLERDLHDGAQQHLVAIAVKLRLVREAVNDPQETLGLLDELNHDVHEAVEALRTLAHGIFPPLLASGGLRDALPAAASRAPLPTTVDFEHVDRYPPQVEAAVYFCCLEALQNAGKHAGEDASATVRVWEAAGELRFEIADDGVGFDPTVQGPADGHGFVNMSDRLGAVGGTLDVHAAARHGVRVTGSIPLH